MKDKSQEKQHIKLNAKRRKYVLAVGQVLDKSMRIAARKRGFGEAELLTAWGIICPEYAQYSYPLKLTKGKLQIAVNSGSAADNMKMWEPNLLQNLTLFFGYEAIHKITYIQKSFKVKKYETFKLFEANTQAIAKAKKKCAYVKDKDLREALVRLGALIYTDDQTEEKK